MRSAIVAVLAAALVGTLVTSAGAKRFDPSQAAMKLFEHAIEHRVQTSGSREVNRVSNWMLPDPEEIWLCMGAIDNMTVELATMENITAEQGSQLAAELIDTYANFDIWGTCEFIKDLANANGACVSSLGWLLGVHDNSAACFVAAQCLGDSPRLPNAVHGMCYKECSNRKTDDGFTVTECRQGILERSGLTHPAVCGESLPFTTLLSFGSSFSELFLTFAGSMLGIVIDKALTYLTASKEVGMHPDWTDIPGMYINAIVVIHCICTANGQLRAANAACRFILLSAAWTYAPFFYAVCRASVPMGRSILWMRQGGRTGRCSCLRFLLLLGPILVIVPVVAFVFVVSLAMLAAVFWDGFAYPHIFILLFVGVVLSLVFFHKVAQCAMRWSRWLRGHEDEDKTFVMGLDVDSLLRNAEMVSFALLVISMYALFNACCFILYFHGHWRTFHEAFFSTWTLPSFPDFFQIELPQVSWATLGRIVTMKFVAPSFVLQLSALVTIAELLLKALWRAASWCASCCQAAGSCCKAASQGS